MKPYLRMIQEEGMVRDGIWKWWEAEENTAWENASRRSGAHDRAGQHDNARRLSWPENCLLAQEDIFGYWENDCRYRLVLCIIITMSTGNTYKKLLYFFLLSFCYQYQLNLQYNFREIRESFTSLQDDIVNLCKIT